MSRVRHNLYNIQFTADDQMSRGGALIDGHIVYCVLIKGGWLIELSMLPFVQYVKRVQYMLLDVFNVQLFNYP